MTEHCRDCDSQICAHGACQKCDGPCGHCPGGDPDNKFSDFQEASSDFQFVDPHQPLTGNFHDSL